MPRPGPCIFCGEKADSKEHAIPAWMADRCGVRGKFLETVEIFGDVTPRKQPISMASHRERIFCKKCNTHFKHLEDQAIPIVESMCRGAIFDIGPEDQRILAAWGAKTGFALIAAEHDLTRIIPEDERRFLRQSGMPSENVWVGYAAWLGRAHKFVGAGEVEDRSHAVSPPPARRAYYQAILAVGQFALKIFGMSEVRLTDLWKNIALVEQVWPKEKDVLPWPPPYPIPDTHLWTLIEYVPLKPDQEAP